MLKKNKQKSFTPLEILGKKISKIRKKKFLTGFTLIELLIVASVLVILIVITGYAFITFQRKSVLGQSSEEIINILRIAQNKTLASEGSSQYGVYFDNSVWPNKYTLFKGKDYISRDISFDKVYELSKSVEMQAINLAGSNEVFFHRITGTVSQPGNIVLILKSDPAESQTIYIEESGQVSTFSGSAPSDLDRIKDSRHIHVDYSRLIDTATETLTLDFGTKTKNISIAGNMEANQIYWEGEVDVDNEIQKIKIHTHNLNNPNTQFCFHRDRRYNTKPLTITISGDGSGALINYSADGSNVNSNSIYVSNITWQ